MARPNYEHEKRARELAKKRKKEEKLKRHQENLAKSKAEEDGETTDGEAPEDGAETTPRDPSAGE